MEDRLVIAVSSDAIEVPVPRSARVDAKLDGRFAEQHVPDALDIPGGKRLSISTPPGFCANAVPATRSAISSAAAETLGTLRVISRPSIHKSMVYWELPQYRV